MTDSAAVFRRQMIVEEACVMERKNLYGKTALRRAPCCCVCPLGAIGRTDRIGRRRCRHPVSQSGGIRHCRPHRPQLDFVPAACRRFGDCRLVSPFKTPENFGTNQILDAIRSEKKVPLTLTRLFSSAPLSPICAAALPGAKALLCSWAAPLVHRSAGCSVWMKRTSISSSCAV